MAEPITGYRQLSEMEIALINEVNDHAKATEELWHRVRTFVTASSTQFRTVPDTEPARWCAIARTDLQQGYMALTRAIANPTSF
jgi:hypothetical protein